MRRRVLTVVIVAIAIFGGYICAGDLDRYEGIAYGDREGFERVLDWSKEFDTSGQKRLRRKRPNDLTTSFGTLVDASCLKGMDAKAKVAASQQMDEALYMAMSKLRSCAVDHPQLEGLLSDVVAIIRRTVVGCTDWSKDPSFYKDRASAYAIRRKPRYDGPKRILEEKGCYPTLFNKAYNFVLPGSIGDFLGNGHEDPGWGLEGRAEIIVHEALHFTGANSRLDHNEITRVGMDSNNPCRENFLDDKVELLVALCRIRSQRSAEFFHRLKRCGIERACVQPMSRADRPGGWFLPSESAQEAADADRQFIELADPREARMLCSSVSKRFHEIYKEDLVTPRLGKSYVAILTQVAVLTYAVDFPYFLASLNEDERVQVAGYADLRSQIVKTCGRFAAPPDAQDFDRIKALSAGAALDPRSLNVLKAVEAAELPSRCVLVAEDGLPQVGERLIGFHNQEQQLQAYARGILDELSASKQDREKEAILEEIDFVFKGDCAEGLDFRPILCANGVNILRATVEAVYAR